MHINGKEFRTIWFDEKDQVVKIIDQTKLPHKFEIINLKPFCDAIKPAVGNTAIVGIGGIIVSSKAARKRKANIYAMGSACI